MPDFLRVLRATILGDTVVVDHLQICKLRQFAQNTIVDAVGEKRAVVVWVDAFKWQNRYPTCRRRGYCLGFRNHHAHCYSHH